MPNILDVVGKRFGRLVVLQRASAIGSKNVMWLCQCDCGETTTGAAANLGKTKFSCGCLQKEVARKSMSGNRLARTGLHGKSHYPEWGVWSRMKDRCYNTNNEKYHRYGGRGITVCDRWLNSFEDFLDDMGRRPSKRYSIDRIDNDGNYEKSNCRWTTMAIQRRNNSTIHWVTINGTKLCLKDWCKFLKVPKWKPTEMVRSRDGRPAKFPDIESALTHLYNLSLQPKRKP